MAPGVPPGSRERAAVQADAPLREQHGAARRQLDQHGDQEHQREGHDQAYGGDEEVEGPARDAFAVERTEWDTLRQ